jgi:3-oxoacyl-[acyl-carrier protein] reductase
VKLAGRVALVTGSSRGIGSAIARRLAADGARVVLHARGISDRLAGVAEQIRGQGGTADIVVGDLADPGTPARVVGEAFAAHGALDILVLNAGGGVGGPATSLTPETIDHVLAVNLRSTILSTIEFAKITQSPHGRVIFISSGAATHPARGAALTAAAKAGAEAFMRSVAQELGQRGITLNSIAPGTTRTDMIKGKSWPDQIGKWAALGRIGEPEDVADVVAFFASDDARWLTGLTIAANGGLITTAANLLDRDAVTAPRH